VSEFSYDEQTSYSAGKPGPTDSKQFRQGILRTSCNTKEAILDNRKTPMIIFTWTKTERYGTWANIIALGTRYYHLAKSLEIHELKRMFSLLYIYR
jgi:hypothetical protein